MPDLGSPSSYLLLQPGVRVYGSDGVEAGAVKEVLAAPDADIFDAILVATRDGDRLVEASHVAEIFERGVELNVRAVFVEALPKA